jgi:hypothetical protein
VWVALLLIALAVAALVYRAWGLVRVALLPAQARSVEQIAGRAEEGDRGATFEGYAATIGGRSLFWRPSAPGQGVVTQVIEEEAPDEPAGNGYEGPAIVAVILDTVWFKDGERVRAGEKGGNGVEVVAVDAPWEATLSHRGTQHVVAIFGRDRLILTNDSDAGKRPSTGDTPIQEQDPAPAAMPEEKAQKPEKGESER